jgi:hypothetical protein
MTDRDWKVHYVDDGWLEKKCCWCGEPAASDEEIEVIQVSSSEGFWMHPPCAQRYGEWCEKEEESFYTNKVLKFVRGEPSGIESGTVGEDRAPIAKDLITQNPSLALRDNLQELITAVEACARARSHVVTLSAEEIAERKARPRQGPPTGERP